MVDSKATETGSLADVAGEWSVLRGVGFSPGLSSSAFVCPRHLNTKLCPINVFLQASQRISKAAK